MSDQDTVETPKGWDPSTDPVVGAEELTPAQKDRIEIEAQKSSERQRRKIVARDLGIDARRPEGLVPIYELLEEVSRKLDLLLETG